MTAIASLPLTDTLAPDNEAELASALRDCFAAETAVYPIGGGTSLDYGLPAKREGLGLSLANMASVVDYPARDMTITVKAGITMQALAETLAAERQRLPIDAPQSDRATLGGVVATNFNGPRMHGQGTMRDHVIGIRAVDGRGMPFKGGGRVVKNVAGYDFCKLLTGSLGTLGVITELTLKLKPRPERLAFVVSGPASLDEAEKLLAALAVQSQTTPCAVELLSGPCWAADAALGSFAGENGLCLAVGLEGTQPELDWMVNQLAAEWRELGVARHQVIADGDASDLMSRLTEFPAAGESPLTLKACLVPSGTTSFVSALRKLDANCDVQAHAGNGIVIARLSEFPVDGLARTLVGKLQPVAAAAHGHLTMLANPSGTEMTHPTVWGTSDLPLFLMSAVKREFDPRNILNPGRFVYPHFD